MNYIEVIGLERFLEKLDRRSNIEGRERGLITVSNHVSVYVLLLHHVTRS